MVVKVAVVVIVRSHVVAMVVVTTIVVMAVMTVVVLVVVGAARPHPPAHQATNCSRTEALDAWNWTPAKPTPPMLGSRHTQRLAGHHHLYHSSSCLAE